MRKTKASERELLRTTFAQKRPKRIEDKRRKSRAQMKQEDRRRQRDGDSFEGDWF